MYIITGNDDRFKLVPVGGAKGVWPGFGATFTTQTKRVGHCPGHWILPQDRLS